MIHSGFRLSKFIDCSQFKGRLQNGVNTFKWQNFSEETEKEEKQMDPHMNLLYFGNLFPKNGT